MEESESFFGSFRSMLPENFELLPEDISNECVARLLILQNFSITKNSKAEKKLNKFKELLFDNSNEFSDSNK